MTRREWTQTALGLSAFALTACNRKKSPRYQGYALIANREGRNLAVVDLSRFQRLKNIPLRAAPSLVLAAPDVGRAFILSVDAKTVEVLNLETLQLARHISLGGEPQSATLSADQKSLWIALRQPAALLETHAGTGEQLSRLPLPATPAGLDIFGRRLAISFPDAGVIGYYAGEGSVKTSAALGDSPLLVQFRGDGEVIVVGHRSRPSVTIVNCASLEPIAELPLALTPRHFCMNRNGGQLFVTGEGSDAVAIVSPYQTEVSETILAGNAPGAMATTTFGPEYLFVASPQSGDMTVISVDTRKVLAQIEVGQSPGTILLTPDNEFALVLNEQSGDMAVIRLMAIRQANLNSRRSRTAALFTLLPVGSKPVAGAIAPRII